MKKNIVRIFFLAFLFALAACSKSAATQSPAATQITAQAYTATQVPVTVTATTTMSSAFSSLLLSETSIPVLTSVTALPVTGTPQPQVIDAALSAEEEHIKKVIQSYFDIRYRAFNTLELDGFDNLISNQLESTIFLEDELSKLQVALGHAERFNLRYKAYEYYLEYENITVDPDRQRATVSLSHGHKVIFEKGEMFSSGEPTVSRMANEEHTIYLQKEDGEWKIVSDNYTDYLWRALRQTGISTDEMLRTMEATPISTAACFTYNQSSTPVPEQTNPPVSAFPDYDAPSNPRVINVYLNEKWYDPEGLYSHPFTNLYLQSDGESTLRFIVELDDESVNQLGLFQEGQSIEGWQIVIYPHTEDENLVDQPAYNLNELKWINCDSFRALLAETTLEEIQKELGEHRVFDYQIVNDAGEILLQHKFYINNFGEYLISDTFVEVSGFDGGIVGYPNLLDESKKVFPRIGKVIVVHEPRGGFFQLHYWISTSNLMPSGIWTKETTTEVVIQVFSYRDDGTYNTESYTFADHRKISSNLYDFKIPFTFAELKETLGQGNEFYIRFLDKDGNIIGEDYFYFVPYTSPNP